MTHSRHHRRRKIAAERGKGVRRPQKAKQEQPMPVDPHLLLAFIATTIIAMVTPGPDMLFILGCGMRGGPKAGRRAAAGGAAGGAGRGAGAAAGRAAGGAAGPGAF